MKGFNFFLIAVCLIALSCSNQNGEMNNVIIKGVVLDSTSNKPVAGAKVTILCWTNTGYDDVTYDKIDTMTDSKGKFDVKFEKGYKADIASIAFNYHPTIKEIKNLKTAQDITLKLVVNNANNELKEWGEIGLFNRSYYIKENVLTEYYGIDLLNGKNTKVIDNSDLYVKEADKVSYPKKIFTSNKGGIIPITVTDKSFDKAPLEGYLQEYILTGKEKGFFIRCRDGKTYGKLMIVSLEYDKSSPYKDGFYKDYGIMFNAILQSSGGNEFNTPSDMRLDYYLLEHI